MAHQHQVGKVKRWRKLFFLLVLNVLLWGTGIYLWQQRNNGPPTALHRFTASSESTEFVRDGALRQHNTNFPIESEHVILVNVTTGEVLFEHDADTRAYPASLTKMMTVLVAIEMTAGEEMTIRADFDGLHLAGAAMAGFEYGEIRSISEVLHGAMLSSGADATETIAYHVSGSYDGFVALMNERAIQIGMTSTNFTNASGLHDSNQYTTAYDMALFLSYALENPVFRQIFTTRNYPILTATGEERVLSSTMFFALETSEFPGGEILGGKDGFTPQAGLCLASLATDGEHEFVLITLGGRSQAANVIDALVIYHYFLD